MTGANILFFALSLKRIFPFFGLAFADKTRQTEIEFYIDLMYSKGRSDQSGFYL